LNYIILHCIPWIHSQNDSRMWNMSYKCKDIYTVQLKFLTQENLYNFFWYHVYIHFNPNISLHIAVYGSFCSYWYLNLKNELLDIKTRRKCHIFTFISNLIQIFGMRSSKIIYMYINFLNDDMYNLKSLLFLLEFLLCPV
jgi:hypothetical protein